MEWEASGNCLGERNECSVSLEVQITRVGEERRGGREKKERAGRKQKPKVSPGSNELSCPAFVGQKHSPNLISHHAFKLPSLDFLWTRNSLALFLSLSLSLLKKKEIFSFNVNRETFKNESDQDCGETWWVRFFFPRASKRSWLRNYREKSGGNLHEFPEKFHGRSTVRLNRPPCLGTFLFVHCRTKCETTSTM